MPAFGVDIGGSGIKGAPVDLDAGRLLEKRRRIPTPDPSVPDAVADVVASIVESFGWDGSVGCAFPAVVKGGVAHSAANIDERWIDCDVDALLTERLGRDVHVVNDADAAGLAEVRYGAAAGRDGVVLLVTLGTGLGTAVFVDGTLVPNTELGHIELHGSDAEDVASERARIDGGLSWKRWAALLDDFLARMERYLSPDLIVLGGGGSKHADDFLALLDRRCEVRPAALGNGAGIVGAAMVAP